MSQSTPEPQPSPSAADLLQALLVHPSIHRPESAASPPVNTFEAIIEPVGAENKGGAVGSALCPLYGDDDPYHRAWAAVDRAVGIVVAAGADPSRVTIQANIRWDSPDMPDHPEVLARSIQGSREAALAYDTPFILVEDSPSGVFIEADNDPQASPGTLLISSVGYVPDVTCAVTIDFKQAGTFIFAVGDTRPELGGSHYAMVGGLVRPQHRATPAPVDAPVVRLRRLHQAISAGLVRSCHHCGAGGIGVALARMCMSGQLGAEIQMRAVPVDLYYAYAADEAVLFSESLTRFLFEVRPADAVAFSVVLGDVPHACIGVVGGDFLRIHPRLVEAADPLLALPVAGLRPMGASDT